MMYKFRFGEGAGPNGKTTTFNGFTAFAPDWPDSYHGEIYFLGPNEGERAMAVINKVTARKLGAALLGWAMRAGEVGQVTGGPEAGYHPGSLADPRD